MRRMVSKSKWLREGLFALLISVTLGCSKISDLIQPPPVHEQKLQALPGNSGPQGPEADREVTDIYRYLVAQKYSYENRSDKAALIFQKMLETAPDSIEVLNAAA